LSKYLVIFYGEIEVEADSEREAVHLAVHKLPDDGFRTHLSISATPFDPEIEVEVTWR
jgi:hypothetical protein